MSAGKCIASAGSIVAMDGRERRRCRSWMVKTSCGGKRWQRRVHGTYSEAVEALEQLRREAETAAEAAAANSVIIDEYAAAYLNDKLHSGAIKSGTYRRYCARFRCFLWHFSGRSVDSITAAEIEQAYIALRAGDSPSGKPLGGTYMNNMAQTVSGMFDRAVRDGYATSNPIRATDLPRFDTKQKQALSSAQARNLLAALDWRAPVQMAVLLCLSLGLRRSEAIAAKWCDLSDGGLIVPQSKTAAGVRFVPLTRAAKNAIQQRREWLAELLQPATPEQVADILSGWPICSDVNGHEINGGSVAQWLARNRDSLGVPGITVHELRHTYATLLAESGASPAAMQKLLGHSSPVTSLKIYTHVHTEQLQQATDGLNELL